MFQQERGVRERIEPVVARAIADVAFGSKAVL